MRIWSGTMFDNRLEENITILVTDTTTTTARLEDTVAPEDREMRIGNHERKNALTTWTLVTSRGLLLPMGSVCLTVQGFRLLPPLPQPL